MGWSCRTDAANTLDKIEKACRLSTGSQNCIKQGEDEFFFDVSRTEHNDGAITGSVFKFTPSKTHCRKAGSFRIEGDGTVTRAPAWMKKAARA